MAYPHLKDLEKLNEILPLLLKETQDIEESSKFAESFHPYALDEAIVALKPKTK